MTLTGTNTQAWRDGSLRQIFPPGSLITDAFKQSMTPDGQLLGVLTDNSLQGAFTKAFWQGHYSIEFTRTDNPDPRTYYVEQGPTRDVAMNFMACMKQVQDSLPPG